MFIVAECIITEVWIAIDVYHQYPAKENMVRMHDEILFSHKKINETLTFAAK